MTVAILFVAATGLVILVIWPALIVSGRISDRERDEARRRRLMDISGSGEEDHE